jgi:hypothetical protein
MNSLHPKKASESEVYGYFRRTKVLDSGKLITQESFSFMALESVAYIYKQYFRFFVLLSFLLCTIMMCHIFNYETPIYLQFAFRTVYVPQQRRRQLRDIDTRVVQVRYSIAYDAYDNRHIILTVLWSLVSFIFSIHHSAVIHTVPLIRAYCE